MSKVIKLVTYSKLERKGIKYTIESVYNLWSIPNHVVICKDNTQWKFIPDDHSYEEIPEENHICINVF